MTLTKLLASDGYICLNKSIIKTFGIATALILGELCSEYNYWESRDSLEEGYFYSTLENIENETTIKRDMQKKVFDLLKQHGVIDVKRKNMPARRYVKIDEDKLFDFLQLCNTESNKENEDKQVQKITQLPEQSNLQFTAQSETSLRDNRKQDYDCNVNYIYNKNNIISNKKSNKTIKDKSFIVCAENDEKEKSFSEEDDLEKENESVSKEENNGSNSISLVNENTNDVLVEENKMQTMGELNDLTNLENSNDTDNGDNITKTNSNKVKDKKVKPFKLKPKTDKKKKKPLGNIDKQFELIDIYFNNGETCNRPDIASLIKQFLSQRIKKIGYKNYSDTRWENQLKLLIENSEGDYDYMIEIIKTSISRDYNDITFMDQKKSLHKFKPQFGSNKNFDTAKDNVQNKGVALFNKTEKEDYKKNNLATDDDGNPMEF